MEEVNLPLSRHYQETIIFTRSIFFALYACISWFSLTSLLLAVNMFKWFKIALTLTLMDPFQRCKLDSAEGILPFRMCAWKGGLHIWFLKENTNYWEAYLPLPFCLLSPDLLKYFLYVWDFIHLLLNDEEGWVEKWTLAVYAAGQTAPLFHLRQSKHCGKRQIYC